MSSLKDEISHKMCHQKEALLKRLAYRLRCDVEDVSFLFDTTRQPLSLQDIYIPDYRDSLS